jgi:nitrite reductase/ring-hydroxylating ferredoxin subunit
MESQLQKNNKADVGPSCVICFEHISLDTKAVVKNCSHEFCLVCIKSWMETTITCPLCKQQIDMLQHSFTSEGDYREEKVEAPNIKRGDSGGGSANVEDQLQCLDHSFFISEVQRLLQDSERRHRQLWQEAQSIRGLAAWEQQRLETVEGVVAELRNHKRKMQALLHFDPHATLRDLYRLQDLLRESWGNPVIPSYTRSHSPVRYSSEDADAAAELSDDDDFAEDMRYLNLGKADKKKPVQRQSKSKVRTPANKIGARNRKGVAN